MFIPLKFVIDFPQIFRYNQYGFTISICIVMPFVGEYDRYTYLYTASKEHIFPQSLRGAARRGNPTIRSETSKPHIQTIRFNGDLYGRKNKPRVDTGIKSADKSAGAHQAPHHLPIEHYRDVGVDNGYIGVVYAL